MAAQVLTPGSTLRFLAALSGAGGTVLLDLGPHSQGTTAEYSYDSNFMPLKNVVTAGSVAAAAAVPEPGSIVLFGTILSGVCLSLKRRSKTSRA
jgi:hypothetical protein